MKKEKETDEEGKGRQARTVIKPSTLPINREYLLAELKCARLRAQLIQNEIDAIGIALAKGVITADQAMQCLQEVGLARWIGPAGSTWNDVNCE